MKKMPRYRMAPSTRKSKSARNQRWTQNVKLGIFDRQVWNIGNASAALAPGVRLRPWTWVNGMRLCLRVENRANIPIEFHWVLFQLKAPTNGTGVAATNAELKPDFFRDNREAQLNTFQDFIDEPTTGASNGWLHVYSCGRLNSMKFRTLKHSKIFLSARPNVTDANNRSYKGLQHIYHYEKYIKMKKRIAFGTTADQIGNYPVYCGWWCTTPTTENYPATSAGDTDAVALCGEMTTYYDAFEST